MKKNYIQNFKGHFNTVRNHKKWVFHYCQIAGIPVQGVLHDLSKFNPIEFFEGVKYFDGSRSPIDVCKELHGYSRAWQHHRGRNKHHYEMWVEYYDHGGRGIIMPYKYILEMVCDYLGAGKAYMKDDFSYEAEWKWWLKKKSGNILMHPATIIFVGTILAQLIKTGSAQAVLNPANTKAVYEYSIEQAKIREEKENE